MADDLIEKTTSTDEWGWDFITETWWHDDNNMWNYHDYEYTHTYALVPIELATLVWVGSCSYEGRLANPKLEYELLCLIEDNAQGQFCEFACPMVDAPDIPPYVTNKVWQWQGRGWLPAFGMRPYRSFINCKIPEFPGKSELEEMGIKELKEVAKRVGALPERWSKKVLIKEAIECAREEAMEAIEFLQQWRSKVIQRYEWIADCKEKMEVQ